MKFTLEINCDGSAFPEYAPEWEISRILKKAAEMIMDAETPSVPTLLWDHNGNRVGQFALTEGSDE